MFSFILNVSTSYPVLVMSGLLINNLKRIDIHDPCSWFCLMMSIGTSFNNFFKMVYTRKQKILNIYF